MPSLGTIFAVDNLTRVLGLTIVSAPATFLAVLGFSTLIGRPLSERATSRLSGFAILTGLLACVGMLALMAAEGTGHVAVPLGNWIALPDSEYHFSVKLLFDYLSLPFAILTFLLCGTIGAFATRYLHREPGYNRFFFLYSVFLLGMVTSALAGTIETLFTGWELVGLSSALLVAFFHERVMPVRNGLHVWAIYRAADAAFLAAAIVLHHMSGHGDFDELLGVGAWPGVQPVGVSSYQALVVGLLLLFAAAGKSGLVPFSGWLPRAMEGPTPSSAVFYGALSVHLGAFLLLRVSGLIALSPALGYVIVAVGLLTALYGALTARAQTDIKSALSFASVTQVGLIVAEIGMGWHWIPLVHLVGHACLRTFQFLRAPMLLADYRTLENAIGGRFGTALSSAGPPSRPSATWLYRLAMERGYLDAWLTNYVARPVLLLFRGCDALERRWTDFLTGGPSRESDRIRPSSGSLEEIV
jgi:NAD(P)H-quinone oxidoreductase subunit 5